MATGDNLASARVRPQSTLLTDVKARTPEPGPEQVNGAETEPGETFVALPKPGSAYDAAFARPYPKPLATLRFLIGDTVRGLPYADLDSIDLVPADKPGAGPMIVMVFAGIAARKAVIAGRHLLLLFDLLCDHRVAWVRELPKGRDFRDRNDTATVITDITISQVEN